MAHRKAPPFIATYRVQLRNGVGLDDVRAQIPWFKQLGVSHLYLSPVFLATSGSTHGYDVIDPDMVDPVIGGDAAFVALADSAREAGLGIVLDIVPNHMAFTPENPYLADVLRHGRESIHAPIFDIDWEEGAIHFPILDGSPVDLLREGQIGLAGSAEVPFLRVYDHQFPLKAGTRSPAEAGDKLDADGLSLVLAEQHWSIGDWRDESRIRHRRFFNISSLIGVRQEDRNVFALTHRWIIDQVRAGRVQGLRVDHIDGLAQPAAYLHRLRKAVGATPIWVEKIVKQDESLPIGWPVQGMSGYELMSPITRFLTAADGLEAMRRGAAACIPDDISAEVRAVRAEMLATTFAPELDRVTRSATRALAGDAPGGARKDSAAVRAAIAQLAMHWPVYRSYVADGLPLGPRHKAAFEAVKQDRMPSEALASISYLLSAPDDRPARAFAARFEQLTGALTAKSEEDTVFFRAISYLPFCEVGSEPELESLSEQGFAEVMQARADDMPVALSTLSTHDTKRSADARAAIIALSYLPDIAASFYCSAREEARRRALPERWSIYAMQIALVMRHADDAEQRIRDHIAKAMREAKDLSRHEDPDETIEAEVAALCLALRAQILTVGALWSAEDAAQFEKAYELVVLAQISLQLSAPGIPDIYQGTEIVTVDLTDPDNRRSIDWNELHMVLEEGRRDLDDKKLSLTRELLEKRRTHPDLFAFGSYHIATNSSRWVVTRRWQDQSVAITVDMPIQAIRAVDRTSQAE
jgi:(1->4)-alpha-D-glucan 1-alpha-D-glucosylmutase